MKETKMERKQKLAYAKSVDSEKKTGDGLRLNL